MNCLEESCDDGTQECEATFLITPYNPKLGLAFNADGPPVDFRFETESWTECIDTDKDEADEEESDEEEADDGEADEEEADEEETDQDENDDKESDEDESPVEKTYTVH